MQGTDAFMVEASGTAPESCIAFELLQRYIYIYTVTLYICQEEKTKYL